MRFWEQNLIKNIAPVSVSRVQKGGGRQHFISPSQLPTSSQITIDQCVPTFVTLMHRNFMSNHRNVRLTPKALGAKAATFEADKAKRRTFIMVWWWSSLLLQSNLDV
jgi:hypothetical protein